jgi:hypothetical protein
VGKVKGSIKNRGLRKSKETATVGTSKSPFLQEGPECSVPYAWSWS